VYAVPVGTTAFNPSPVASEVFEGGIDLQVATLQQMCDLEATERQSGQITADEYISQTWPN